MSAIAKMGGFGILADKSSSIGDLNDIVGFFLALVTAAATLLIYMKFMKSNKQFGPEQYVVIGLLIAGSAIWLFFVLRS